MPRRILELGLAGFGQLARKYYLPALPSLNDVRISVVVDPLDTSLEVARQTFPEATTGADPGCLFTRRLDGLIVASPPSTHASLWNLAANASLPVLLEKPFVLRGELEHVVASQSQRRLLMLDQNRRFWPPYCELRNSVRAGLVGDLENGEICLHVDIRPWCSVTAHRLQPTEGGVLYDLGSQAIDLARWITGAEPLEVTARSESHRWDHDHILLELGFEGGFRIFCNLAYTEHITERVVIRGQRGEMRLLNPNTMVHLVRAGQDGRWLLDRIRDLAVFGYRGVRRSQSMMRYSVAAALRAFTRCILSGQPFSPGFDDAVANTRWLDAAALALELVSPVNSVPPDRSMSGG